jgi:HEAT repeat protein
MSYILAGLLWFAPAGGDGLDEAQKLASAKDPRDREKAARAVLERPGVRAARLLLELAADEHAGVRQEAIHSMRKLTGDGARGLVLKAALTARHPWVRACACEAAGAYADTLRRPVLERALRDGQAAVRRAAVRALMEGASPSTALAAEVAKRLKDRDSGVRCAAIEALALLDPAAAKAGLAALERDRAPEVRVARLLAAQRLPERSTAVNAAVVALSDRHWTVQAAAMAVLAESGDQMSAASLIAALRAVRGRLRIDCTRALQKLTGKQIGPDPDLWQAWLAAQWGKADGYGLQSEPRKKRAEPETQASFFSIPLDARNVTFILDLSKSMGDAPKAGAPPRIETARKEIAATAKSLPMDARVNAITFGRELNPFAPSLRIATPGVRAALVQWVNKQPIGGGTNIFDSLELALRDKRVDAIYLLTDGGATTGQFIDNGDILEQIARRNRYRRVHIHTIAVGRTSRGRSLLKQLAEQSGGTYVER